MKNLLVLNNIEGVEGLKKKLEDHFHTIYLPNATYQSIKNIDLSKRIEIESIYTNPNKSRIQINKHLLDMLPNLKVICTASTGTVHIDKNECSVRNIDIISIAKEIPVLEKISSTAEMSFLLMMAGIRNFVPSIEDVRNGNWDCDKFVGRQINNLNVGIIGYGRLGKMFYKYCEAFNSKIHVYDPYVKIDNLNKVESLKELVEVSDVIAIHVHVTDETKEMINEEVLSYCKCNMIMVNTSRGEIIEEHSMINFLKKNPNSKYYTDVVSSENLDKESSPIYDNFRSGKLNNQIIVTPHVGGVTHDARYIAYNHAAKLLIDYFNE